MILALAACGEDTPVQTNGTADCPAMAVTADGTSVPPGGVPDLIISEVSPDAFIELYNTTDTDIPLVSSEYYLCSPFDYQLVATMDPDGVVPAKGYITLPYPSEFTDNIARGELILFKDGVNFFDPDRILDFVCWGQGTRGSRYDQAVTAGKWSGDCAGGLLNRSIHRLSGNAGTDATSYDTTTKSSPSNCAP